MATMTEQQKAEASHLLLGEAYFKRGVACDCAPDEGCMWCCRACNVDHHWCPGCGTVTDHKNTPCPECVEVHR